MPQSSRPLLSPDAASDSAAPGAAASRQSLDRATADLPLNALLARTFGFSAFRANQEEVCRAAIAGRDVLLVMPTGAGKSLCYQLPAVARGGTALVISPLIALMEDQAAKLAARGLRVARIHSGLDRQMSRQACVDYLNGSLQFLFIAPERLRVPGFAEMLGKRKPSLIAIDEAHCISQWGHDFRPDYRMLGQHLHLLRPAPVLALTATATPVVQNDILAQLALHDARRFIHGFRRDNLAIEVVEVPKPMRTERALELLRDPERRPAIVYAPTRKEAEETAAAIAAHFPAAAYHAGLTPEQRERAQRQFLEGRLEVVVATIAFGMGIDKADVRTVIHTALPASLEAYYQEIGRAGRDGRPSRTILMHSYADRRTHEFFLERDYPAVDELERIHRRLSAEPIARAQLQAAMRMDAEIFEKALEKLYIHGAVNVTYDDMVSLGADASAWRRTYRSQADHRRQQLELVARYAEGHACRMASLVAHFGDTADSRRLCGHCDFCSPERAIAQSFRGLSAQEEQAARGILKLLRSGASPSTGRLYKELYPREEIRRNDFDDVLGALAAAGMVRIEEASFEKDGKPVNYRKAALTREGEEFIEGSPLQISLRERVARDLSLRERATRGTAKRSKPAKAPKNIPEKPLVALTPESAALEERLKEWRLAIAKKEGKPAFFVFGDSVLRSIAQARPRNLTALAAIHGVGAAKLERFGADVCRLCTES